MNPNRIERWDMTDRGMTRLIALLLIGVVAFGAYDAYRWLHSIGWFR